MALRSLSCVLLLVVLAADARAAVPVDDCHAAFSAYAGVRPYIVNPASGGRSQATILAVFDYPSAPSEGHVRWTITLRSVDSGKVVANMSGREALPFARQVSVERTWNGLDVDGRPVPDGEYEVDVRALFWEHELRPRLEAGIEQPDAPALEAVSSTVRLVIDRDGEFDALFDAAAASRRKLEHAAVSIDPTFPWDFYFGVNHAHTSWSDGGMPVTDCSSGRYGYAGGAEPADAFQYARTTGDVDFIGVVDHNHLMQEACSGCSASTVLARYQAGFDAAAAATVPGSFVGLWGMEWGVISGGGHLNIYNQPNLMSWSGEPFDVEVAKSDYLALYDALAANQGALGSYGTFNHPNSSDFSSWQRSASGDAVMRGLSIISGPAFSTSTSFTPGGSTYGTRYDQALSYGWKIAPEAHQDNHCWNFGNSNPNRTVALIGAGTQFDQASLLDAMNSRRIYAAQDRDVQLRWGTADGVRVMGESFSSASPVSVRAAVSDPAGEGVQKIEIRGGRAGSPGAPGASPTVLASITSSGSLDAQLAPQATGEEWYYYVVAVQADGDTAWSAPMWIDWTSGGGGGGDVTPPSVAISSPASGATVSGTTAVGATASDDIGVSRVEFRVDGTLLATTFSAPHEFMWSTSTMTNGAHTVTATAFDAAGNSAMDSISVNVSNQTSGSNVDVSGWSLTQANASYQFTLPQGTTIPAGGYVVIARSADRAAFESFWGVSLGAQVTFVNSGGSMPVINGDETYVLGDAAGGTIDGTTIPIGSSQSVQRVNLCGSAGTGGSWQVLSSTAATAGTGAPGGCGAGVRISEFSDASGTGNYIYEFIELYNDAATTGDVTPPVVAITSPAEGSTVAGVVAVSVDASDDTGVQSVEIMLDGAIATTLSSSPWVWNWDTTTASNGSHQVSARAVDTAGNATTSAMRSVTVDNDTTAPVVTITAPADGAGVSGTVLITVSASDAGGIDVAELWIDGSLFGTDSVAPYEWSWDTTGVSAGAHTMQARATDHAGNEGVSSLVTVQTSAASGIDLSGWRLTQSSASLTWYLPAGTTIPSGGYLIVGRNATREAFEAFWGVTLGANVVYVNSGDSMPQINGSESYSLYDGGTRIDGNTISMGSSAGQSLQRARPCGASHKSNSWSRVSSANATPGSGAPPPCGKGIYISEFSDAAGTGNWIYEFIEIHNEP